MNKIVPYLFVVTSVFLYPVINIHAQNIPTPRISPIPSQVGNITSPRLSLNGDWQFSSVSIAKTSIKVPGEWVMQGFDIPPEETAIYTRKLDIPAAWKSLRVYIRFDGVSSHGLVKVNGQKVAEHEGSFVPFEADITDALTNGDNVLTVEVRAHTISDMLACTSQYATHTVGGLLRNVSLFTLPKTNLADLTILTPFDKSYKNAWLKVKAELSNLSDEDASTAIRYTLRDANGKTVLQQQTKKITIGRSHSLPLIDSFKVKSPQHWTSETPYLYQLTTELLVDDKPAQTVVNRVGFRDVKVNGNELLVNGKPIKLRGVNRHSVHPLTGRSISAALDRKDAELFRAANCNYIRTSHYPPSQDFLDAADELGLFVESEASLAWIEHGASPIWKLWDYTDEKFLPYMIQANVDNVQANKNHPSLIIWSLGNESKWSPLWAKVKNVVKKIDPSRPTSFHDQCWGGYNNAGSSADIANYHYPGIDGPAATDTMSRPTLFGEYAHLSTYNRRELLTDPGVRDFYNEPLVRFYDSIYAHKGNLGGAIWSGIDDTFHLPDGQIVGYGPWGPIDGWRRPKPEYWGMKKAYSPVKVTHVHFPVGKEKALVVVIENRHDFLNLNQVKISAKINDKVQEVQADINARSKGKISIPIKEQIRSFEISFIDPRGFTIDEEHYQLEEENKSGRAQYKLSMMQDSSSIRVLVGEVQYLINRRTGMIDQVRKGKEILLNQGPVFTFVPLNSEDGGKPNVAGETYQNDIHLIKNYAYYTLFVTDMDVTAQQDSIVVQMDVTYNEGSGKQRYVFRKDATFTTEYAINSNQKDASPYQYGLMMQLPKRFDRLSWKRKGPFSWYPADHIGRNVGTAKLLSKPLLAVEEVGVRPLHPWKDDANTFGSNDFRSTKKAICEATLVDEAGAKVQVLSNADQASRTWLQDGQINWLIADYCNNGSERFYGSPFSDGRIKVNDKPLKGKLTIKIQ